MEGKGNDCYYYAQGYSREGDRLYRLNISKIIESSTGSNDEKIEFELVHDLVAGHEHLCGVGYVNLNSGVYLLGGEKGSFLTDNPNLHELYLCEDAPKKDRAKWFNRKVFAVDLSNKCQMESEFPDLTAPKTNPLVFCLEDMVYVLSQAPSYGSFPELETPIFEVLDTKLKKWRSLPDPPLFKPGAVGPEYDIIRYNFWKDKLIISDWLDWRVAYIFDFSQEKWETISPGGESGCKFFTPFCHSRVAEYKDFVIGMPFQGCDSVVACRLDSQGFAIPESLQHLVELDDVVLERRPGDIESVFISPLGDPGLICLVCSVAGDFVMPHTVVVVFSVSSSPDGKHLTAAVLAKQVVQTMQLTVSGVDLGLEPAFVICESLKERTAQPSSDVVSKRGKLHCFLDQSGVGGLE